ncbi:MAG: acetate kinase, partial [Lentisphaeria bacterium]|nr:acetate kinase [Lentisphaeria bacterium]
AAAAAGNERAALAIKMFVRRIVKYIGSYFLMVGNTDAVVFTGGIGEFSVNTRKRIIEQLYPMGIMLDEAANKECFGKAGVISTADSKIKAIVMPTDEEKMIALTTAKIVFGK